MGLAVKLTRKKGSHAKPVGLVSVVIAVLCAAPLGLLLATPLPWEDQALFGLVLFAIALAFKRFVPGRLGVLALMGISLFCTMRYLIWRYTQSYLYLRYQGAQEGVLDLLFVSLLLGAETYAFVTMLLGYFQGIRPLDREPTPMPSEIELWPSVDLFIPTYNEPLTVIKPTILSAKNIDWPKDRLRIYVLDDGRRPEIRDFAEQCGVGYITRTDNSHAKAGNLNHALKQTKGEFVAVFDCDHVPTRSFLQVTMGGFLQDPKLGLVQTPHHFYTRDPFERNLGTGGKVPNENELFYGITQAGNDFWNMAFFCGSCAVLRRTALEEVDGVAVETVTEDAHTSLKMQRLGWNSSYIKIPQAAGLATATLRHHVTQRTRWARGMTQILRLDNPLFGKGLRLAQRLCFFNSAVHYLHAAPRLIFLTAPLAYLLLGRTNLYGYGWAILAYGLPHILLGTVASSRAHGRYRHTFWNEVYETVLAPFILLPTTATLFSPHGGTFNVTPKSRIQKDFHFDWPIASPFIALAALNFLAVGVGIHQIAVGLAPTGTVLINIGWAFYSLIILGAAIAAAYERPEMRENARIKVKLPVVLKMAEGMTLRGQTLDLSMGGAAIVATDAVAMPRHGRGLLLMHMLGHEYELPVVIVSHNARYLALSFSGLTLSDEEALARVLFSRADSWLTSVACETDRPLVGLARVTRAALSGYWTVIRSAATIVSQAFRGTEGAPRRAPALPTILLAGAGLLLWATISLRGQTAMPPGEVVLSGVVETRNLESLGRPQPIVLTVPQEKTELYFAVPLTKVVVDAALQLQFRNSATIPAGAATLRVLVNDIEAAAIPLEPNGSGVRSVSIAPESVTSDNTLTFSLDAACAPNCTGKEQLDLWIRIEPATNLTIRSRRLALANDLRLLPAPFVDPSTQTAFDATFVLERTSDSDTLAAAGVIASWFGVVADHRAGRFSANREKIPAGNVVLIARSDSQIAQTLGLQAFSGPGIALRDNPIDPYGKVLALLGKDSGEILLAARALTSGTLSLSGDAMTVGKDFQLPKPRRAYDVPRWLDVEKAALLTDLARESDLTIYPGAPLEVYFRVPPDLYYGPQAYIPLELRYETSGLQEGLTGEIAVTLNGKLVAHRSVEWNGQQTSVRQSIPLPTSDIYPNNTLRVTFVYDEAAGTERSAGYPAIHLASSSAIDFSGFRHYAIMPNLGLFANAGFPFTRHADLSSTVVAFPDDPSEEQIALYLEVMGFFGSETGSPALHLEVAQGNAAASLRGKDLLVIGSAEDQPLFRRWANRMPVRADQLPMQSGRIGPRDQFRWLWRSLTEDVPSLDSLVAAPAPPDLLVQGFQSPEEPGHSVVAFVTAGRHVRPKTLPLAWSASADDVFGSVAVLEGEHFLSFPLVTGEYFTGMASSREQLGYRLLNWFWFLPIFIAGLVLVLARLVRNWLDSHADLRLGAHS